MFGGVDLNSVLYALSYGIIPGIFAITVHEVAHGWAARKLGDPTAYMLGRLTLNPFKHVDPIGTVVVPIATYALAQLPFGWAKPVPVSTEKRHGPRSDLALLPVARPVANLVTALTSGTVPAAFVHAGRRTTGADPFRRHICQFGMQFNPILAVLNLVP